MLNILWSEPELLIWVSLIAPNIGESDLAKIFTKLWEAEPLPVIISLKEISS